MKFEQSPFDGTLQCNHLYPFTLPDGTSNGYFRIESEPRDTEYPYRLILFNSGRLPTGKGYMIPNRQRNYIEMLLSGTAEGYTQI